MRPATKSLHEVAYPRPLRECGIEELAIHQMTANPSGGVLFARKSEHEQKDRARIEVLRCFTTKRGKLSILTMPGLSWKFERELLRAREGRWEGKEWPKSTFIQAVESDRSIYHAAMLQMPGVAEGALMRVCQDTMLAERAVGNPWVQRFFFTDIDAFMTKQFVHFDGAWLDYTGPLSIKRLETISQFYQTRLKGTLVITSLKARWNRDTVSAIERSGGLSAWIRDSISGHVLHDIEYQDGGSPMLQIAIAKKRT